MKTQTTINSSNKTPNKTSKNTSNKAKQQGFTLVEISIVLVIIGLLMGGVLKGQELIKSAKIKAAASDVSAYSVALITYQDRFGDLFLNGSSGNFLAGANFGNSTKEKSQTMLQELANRGLVSAKTEHALGGEILLIKNGSGNNGTLGSAKLAQNNNTFPKVFNWGLCYTDITSEDDAQSLIRAIDGANVDFATGANGTAYSTGKARLVSNSSYESRSNISQGDDNTTVCFEL